MWLGQEVSVMVSGTITPNPLEDSLVVYISWDGGWGPCGWDRQIRASLWKLP